MTLLPVVDGVLFDADVANSGTSRYQNVLTPQGTITVVDDPINGAGRKVMAFATDDHATINPRTQAEIPYNLGDGSEVYIGACVMVPTSHPDIPTGGWLAVAEVFGPPFSGSAPFTLALGDNGSIRIVRNATNGFDVAWTETLVKGTWYHFVFKVKLSTNNTVGYYEVWLDKGSGYTKLALKGSTSPLMMATLDSSNNGGANTHQIKNYRKLGIIATTQTIYHADHKVGASFDLVAASVPGGGTMLTQVSTSRATTWATLTQVSTQRSTSWNVSENLAQVSTTRSTSWVTRAAVATTRATTWTTRQSVAATRSTTWRVLGAVSTTRATSWETRQGVTISRATTWATNQAVTSARATTWATHEAVSTTRTTTWAVLTQVSTQRSTSWNVAGSLLPVSTARSTTWAVRAEVGTTRATTWTVRATITTSRSTSWSVLVGVSTSRATTWAALSSVVVTRSTSWAVAETITVARVATWALLQQVVAEWSTTWETQALLGPAPTATPPERLAVVPAERRMTRVPTEGRITTVPAERRIGVTT